MTKKSDFDHWLLPIAETAVSKTSPFLGGVLTIIRKAATSKGVSRKELNTAGDIYGGLLFIGLCLWIGSR